MLHGGSPWAGHCHWQHQTYTFKYGRLILQSLSLVPRALLVWGEPVADKVCLLYNKREWLLFYYEINMLYILFTYFSEL